MHSGTKLIEKKTNREQKEREGFDKKKKQRVRDRTRTRTISVINMKEDKESKEGRDKIRWSCLVVINSRHRSERNCAKGAKAIFFVLFYISILSFFFVL